MTKRKNNLNEKAMLVSVNFSFGRGKLKIQE